MTACVNRKHTKKVAAVVTASLVGALSLGVAPVAAVADTGIETLAVEWFTGATVTKATNGQGGNVSDPSKATFGEKEGKYLEPTQVTNNNGDVTDVDVNDYTFNYYGPNSQITLVASTNPSVSGTTPEDYFTNTATAGTYFVQIVKKGSTEKTDPIPFKIGAEDEYAGTYATYKDSKDIVFDGTDILNSTDLKFEKADGTELVKAATGDYDSVTWTTQSGGTPSTTTSAGTYTAVLKKGTTTVATVKVTVAKYDISAAAPTFPDLVRGTAADGSGITINWSDTNTNKNNGFKTSLLGSGLAGHFSVSSVASPDGTNGFTGARGEYSVTVAANSNDSNVTGTTTIKFSNLDFTVFDGTVDAYYGSDKLQGLTVNLTEGEAFDPAKVRVRTGDGKTSYSGDQLEVTCYDASDKKIDASEMTEAGGYKVVVRVKPFQKFDGTWYGGSNDFTITVRGNDAYDTNLAFYVDGELAGTDATVRFDGTDQLERITAVVKDSEGNAYEFGTDYTFEVKNAAGKVVDSAVDVDVYKVTIKPLTFTFDSSANSDITLKLTVNPMPISDNSIVDPATSAVEGKLKDFVYVSSSTAYANDALGYTGSAIELPAVAYPVINEDNEVEKDDDGNIVYAELDSSLYNVVSIKDDNNKVVKELKDEGTYTVKIALSDEAGDNYSLKDDVFKVQVKKYEPFGDVKSPAWYAPVIETAKHNGYVNGISGTNLYAPEANITRADAVCILFNMADGKKQMEDFEFSEVNGWVTGFSDVDGHAYYAQALAWAKAFGVANGYGDGTFQPFAQITREEFASMLANYAKTQGKFVAADESALDGVSDANTVSDWAEDNVAWAVENGVMGNGGFVAGQSNITRAEVAAMGVNFQPEPFKK